MIVQCISPRTPFTVDVIYGTGTWEPQESKDVPDDLAKKMLRHADVYAVSKAKAKDVHKVLIAPASPDEPLQEVYDSLRNMNREQMRGFIETKFGLTLDMRNYKTDDSLRQYATMLVEQYGVA